LTISLVLADANILFSRTLRDYFLYAADAGAIEIHWSQQILDEMSRNLRERIGLGQTDSDRLEELMNAYIEYALIDVAPEDLATVQNVEMDAKDRHVLAAAVSVDADILLTQNTKHFPRAWMTEHGIELLNAGELLSRLAEHFPDKIQAAHQQTVRRSRKPEAEILSTLESVVGESVAETVRALAANRA
jgi:predicted nucleic acid-binding protein